MTTTTATLASDRTARRAALERRGTGQAFWGALLMVWTIGLWFWAIFTIVQILVSTLLARALSSMDGSVTISVGPVGAPQIFLFVMGVVTGAGLLTLHAVAGATRRSAARGWLLAAPVVGVTFAVASVAVVALVRWLAALGWTWLENHQAPSPFSDAPQTAAALAILGTLAFLTGIAVNATYRRLGGGPGTLALPLVLAPVLLGHWALVREVDGTPAIGVEIAAPLWLGALALTALAAVGVHLLLRRIPID